MLLLFNASLNHTYRAAKKLKLYACVSNCVEIQGIYNSAKIILICIPQITGPGPPYPPWIPRLPARRIKSSTATILLQTLFFCNYSAPQSPGCKESRALGVLNKFILLSFSLQRDPPAASSPVPDHPGRPILPPHAPAELHGLSSGCTSSRP